MKATICIAVLTFLCFINPFFAQEEYTCLEFECVFDPGEQVYVFGNDVKLRTTPDTGSETLALLKIGEWVKIIEKTDSTWPYHGFDSPFYKVKYNDMTGYILGGLLSLERKTINGTNYFITHSREGEKIYLHIRSLYFGSVREEKVLLKNANISIKTYDNRGIQNLDGILYIDYHPEFDGDESGGIYLFAYEGSLSKYELSQYHDELASHYFEKFIFPDEEGGIPEKIIFKKERAFSYIKDYEWVRTNTETWILYWDSGALTPNFREKYPDIP